MIIGSQPEVGENPRRWGWGFSGPGNRGEPSVQSLVGDVRAAYDRHTGFLVLSPFVSAPLNFAPLPWAMTPAVVRLRRGARETEPDDDGDGQNK